MEIEHVNKMSTPNKGIHCVVNTCLYHMSGDHCGAEKIEVRPKNAESCEETDCATFTCENRNPEGIETPNRY